MESAAEVATAALKMSREEFGERHLNVSLALDNLAIIEQERRRFQQAETLFKESFGIKQEAIPNADGHWAASHINLASLYEATGRYSEAHVNLQQAIVIMDALDVRGIELIVALNNLADMEIQEANYSSAIKRLLEADKLLHKIDLDESGIDHRALPGAIQSNLARAYLRMADLARAERHSQLALDEFGRQKLVEHPAVGSAITNRGEIAFALGVMMKRYRSTRTRSVD